LLKFLYKISSTIKVKMISPFTQGKYKGDGGIPPP